MKKYRLNTKALSTYYSTPDTIVPDAMKGLVMDCVYHYMSASDDERELSQSRAELLLDLKILKEVSPKSEMINS